MRIGIDIDDTTVVTVNSMIKYADIYNTSVLGKENKNDNLGLVTNRYYLKVLYDWTTKEKYDFFNMYYKNVLEECTPMPNTSNVFKKLKNDGHEIYFITARIADIPGCNTEQITKNTLKEADIPYDKLIINAKDKVTACKENQIEFFIEDSYETCQELAEINIPSILMTSKMNKNIEEGNIKRVHNWIEIYDEISKYSKCTK